MRADLSSYLEYIRTAANTEISQMGSYNAVQMINQFTIAKKHAELTGNTALKYMLLISSTNSFESLGYQPKYQIRFATLECYGLSFSNKVEADVAFTDYVNTLL